MKKMFYISGVISCLRLSAEIGKFASYKPIFLPEDYEKFFSKISGN
jgi:hypothetical protein